MNVQALIERRKPGRNALYLATRPPSFNQRLHIHPRISTLYPLRSHIIAFSQCSIIPSSSSLYSGGRVDSIPREGLCAGRWCNH